ncbi:uncharacterized protein BX663DRAFT_7505 [Cokeromyces recurvatus]|uniref:uncharacterized protein n=1 Tax=Cokeromyces recurvatus TaxID=90255 RepID=UPI00221F0F52|nr:uncharacterized protein BX663DRAFT_7505 [Cokeromyces recurvatus]KAI7907673.1 hypothetical protein BX663DRAFT_7505 [Cokeromyces recurvatus]
MANTRFYCCCNKLECPQLKVFNESFKKTEEDAFLAAEIGQMLLLEKNNNKEISIKEYNSFKETLQESKELYAENVDLNKMITVLQSEIQLLKEQHSVEIDHYKRELERINYSKQELLNTEERHESQISDLKQELEHLQKTENHLRNKYKRLGSNYETLQLSYDAVLKEHDTLLYSLSMPDRNKNHIKELAANNTKDNACMSSMTISPNNNRKAVEDGNLFELLHTVTQQTLDKINATDTRVLNRKLRKVFDMTELSNKSNSILRGILADDLSTFRSQFNWTHHDPTLTSFFSLVTCIKGLLQELGSMKMTLNDLQADYVRRIEQLTQYPHGNYCLTAMSLSKYKPDTLVQVKKERRQSKNNGFIQGLVSIFTVQ